MSQARLNGLSEIDDDGRAITGYVLSFSDPSAIRSALALRQAIWRKGRVGWQVCGIPGIRYSGHGSDITSRHLAGRTWADASATHPSSAALRNIFRAIETLRGRITLCGETSYPGGSRMAIDPERVKVLFLASIERGDPADRRAFLDAEAGDDTELRDRLDALLAAYDQPPGALDRPLGAEPEVTDGLEATPSGSSPPPVLTPDNGLTDSGTNDNGPVLVDTIIADRYKIRQEIGEGGMGTVFLAEQLRPVRRQVALKLIKRGMDSRNVLARFESERQALALMDHPHIARVLDAGTTDDGRPFFVMELVKGIPDQRVLRRPPPRPERPAGAIPPGVLGGAARAPEGDHPPRPQALQHPGRKP